MSSPIDEARTLLKESEPLRGALEASMQCSCFQFDSGIFGNKALYLLPRLVAEIELLQQQNEMLKAAYIEIKAEDKRKADT